MPLHRQELISELERVISDLREERISHWKADDYLFYLFGRTGLRWHVEEIHNQLHQIREEVTRLRNEPVRCAYTEDRGQVLHMLTGMPGETERDLKYIKKKSQSNEWLIITDPYFLQWSGPNRAFVSEKIYTEYIVDYIPKDLKKLDLFILPDPNKRIQKKFNDKIRSRGTLISYWETTEIHDRTIIRDNMTGTMMGTSFGGLGNKLAFILDIPPKDLENFMQQLNRIRGGV